MAIVIPPKAGVPNLRPLKQPLYDTELLKHNTATTEKTFFVSPISQPIVAAGAIKTEADTNLEQSGAIGKPTYFDLYGFQFRVNLDSGGAGDGINIIANMQLLYERGIFEFFMGQQRPYLEDRLSRIPAGLDTDGCVTTADTTNNPTYAFASNGEKSSKEYFEASIGGQPIPIQYSESFRAKVSWTGGITITTSGQSGYRLTCFMKGIFYSSL